MNPRRRPFNHPREVAFREDRTTYQGNPCARGHDGTRRTENGSCVECERLWGRTRRTVLMPDGSKRRVKHRELMPEVHPRPAEK